MAWYELEYSGEVPEDVVGPSGLIGDFERTNSVYKSPRGVIIGMILLEGSLADRFVDGLKKVKKDYGIKALKGLELKAVNYWGSRGVQEPKEWQQKEYADALERMMTN